MRKILLPLLVLMGLSLAGCGEYGQVEQGRTVGFDKEAATVTIIKDNGIDDKNPQYTVLPPIPSSCPPIRPSAAPTPPWACA